MKERMGIGNVGKEGKGARGGKRRQYMYPRDHSQDYYYYRINVSNPTFSEEDGFIRYEGQKL